MFTVRQPGGLYWRWIGWQAHTGSPPVTGRIKATWLKWNYTSNCKETSSALKYFQQLLKQCLFQCLSVLFLSLQELIVLSVNSVEMGFVVKVVCECAGSLGSGVKRTWIPSQPAVALEGDRNIWVFLYVYHICRVWEQARPGVCHMGYVTIRWCCDPLNVLSLFLQLWLKALSWFEAHGWGPLKAIFINTYKACLHVQSCQSDIFKLQVATPQAPFRTVCTNHCFWIRSWRAL